ncbi:MAG: mechanosensitive ion channel [Bacteroidales bacterium]|nr:mechanosensitive ion channel [Bacteroidales bacterium]
MEKPALFIETYTGITPDTQSKILVSIGIIIVLYVFRTIFLRIVWRNTEDVKTRYLWKRVISYVVPITSIILIGTVWVHAFRYMGAFLGLLSAGIAIALKDLLANMAGWLFIMFRKPFVIGDRIQIGPHTGDVIDLRLYQFSILEIGNWVHADQSTGRIIHIPNGKVFTEPQANFTQGFHYIWNELEIRLTFESNWQNAKDLLTGIVTRHTQEIIRPAERDLKEASKLYLIHYQYLTPIIYVTVMEYGILLSVRYLCDPHKRRGTEAAIWEDILSEFARHGDIQWAYPTRRFIGDSRGTPAS